MYERDADDLKILTQDDIIESVSNGYVVNDLDDSGRLISTANGSDWFDGSSYDDTDVDAKIDASELGAALTRLSMATDREAFPTGLVLRKTIIEGDLELAWLRLDFPLRFDGCLFTGWVNFDYADLLSLRLDSCTFNVEREVLNFGSIGGRRANIREGLWLHEVFGLEQIFLPDFSTHTFDISNILDPKAAASSGRFRMVLDGSSIDRLVLNLPDSSSNINDRSKVDATMPPLGAPSWLRVGSVQAPPGLESGNGTRKHGDAVVSVDVDSLAAWISSGDGTPTYSRQVWESFAAALDADAMANEAVKLRIHGRRFGRKTKRYWVARFWDWVLDVTVGYGYANHRAFFIWCGLFAITAALVSSASTFGWVGGQPELDGGAMASILYALSVVLSPVGVDGPQDWFFGGVPLPLALAFTILKISSVVLLGLFVSGVAGILRRN